MLNILIAEDNIDFSNSVTYLLKQNTNKFHIMNVLTDGFDTLNFIHENLPNIDIILLDLDMPSLNGVQILETIKKLENLPKIIVMSGNTDLFLNLYKKKFPINYSFHKPFEIDELMNYLNQITFQLANTTDEITNLLNNFSFNKSSLGYHYIIACLLSCIEKKITVIPSYSYLYRMLLGKFSNISEKSIKWNIDKAIMAMNKYTDQSTLQKYFPYSINPSSKVFLNEMLSIYYLNNKKTDLMF